MEKLNEMEEFRERAHQIVDWMADYMESVEQYPVKSRALPKEIYDQIADTLPSQGEQMNVIFEDFKNIILPGITHWQSPNFFAYFQANTSPPSILAEMVMATLGIQGMKWDTSPASTELEERMMEWLRDSIGIPSNWSGVIQDTASTATLASILTAREQQSDFEINKKGFGGQVSYRVYCSEETHSSIEKGVKIAGIGSKNLVKIPTDDQLRMRPDLLRESIKQDVGEGFTPLCIVAALGTTGTLAMDPIRELAEIAKTEKVWLHIDAAYAGTALLLPEYSQLIDGIEHADSFVFNPHKWMFTNFDCTAYFVKDKEALINTFTILPEYLKTQSDGKVNNHCDWGIPLGRRFRSLKLWFVMRSYGLQGLQVKLRHHIDLAKWLEDQIKDAADFVLAAPRSLNLVCFYHQPKGERQSSIETLNHQNELLLQRLNASGRIYLTHTKVRGRYVLRMSIGQTNVQMSHVSKAWKLIGDTARSMLE